MKKIKTLLIIMLLLILTSESYSQIGVKAGLNLANVSNGTSSIIGYQFGLSAEFPKTGMFSFETGAQISTMGYKLSGYYADYELNTVYFVIPLHAKAKFDVGGLKLYGILGPYLGMGLYGKEFSNGGEGSAITWGSNSEFKRMDMGLDIGAGVKIKAVQIGLTYSLGLVDINSYSGNGSSMKNRVLSISVGYMFGNKK